MIAFEPGEQHAGLRIVREIGRGAYGRVYLAEDPTIGRRVALKVLSALPGGSEARRALREARMVGRIQSPNTVTLYRAIPYEEHDSWLLEMEYVAGGSLTELLGQDEAIPVDRVVALAKDIFEGLKAAHEAGVIHGDIKPGNVLLDPSGRAKLADFGLGWALDETLATSSRAEALGGTPAYMAPEVIMGERSRAASDLWSAGVVLHRMLGGKPPFPSGSLQELFAAVQNAPPAPLPASVPVGLHELVDALLRKDPLQRPPSAASVLGRLAGVGTAAPQPTTERPQMSDRARPALAPLFGRDEEREKLQGHVEGLSSGKGKLVLLSGDVGVGKTTLIRHVAAGARESGATVLQSTATELDGLLGPLFDACRRALTSATDLSLGAEARAAIELDRSVSGPVPTMSMEQLGWALERFLGALSEHAPVVLVVDNVQVARSEEVVILRELARALHESPVLLLVSCLAAGVETSASATRGMDGFRELAALEGVVHVTLAPLAPEALLQVLYDRNEGVRLEPDVARRVVDTAEGNPLLALELLRHLQDTGQVLLEGSTVRSSGEWGGDSLPQRVHDVVARRLEGLDDDARALIDAAAVDGRVFDGAAVQSVVGQPLLNVLRGLQRLYRERRLVEPDGDAFRFGSRVIHEVIYAQVAPALRKALHEQLALYYEQSDTRIVDERLAIHWERAGQPERARPYLVRAAHAARERQDDSQVISLFARAGLEPDPIPEDWIRDDPASVLVLCRALHRLDESDAARRLSAALAIGATAPAIAEAAGVQHAEIVFYASGVAAVDQELLVRVAANAEPSLARGDALYLQGVIAKHEGDLERARPLLERAERDYEEADLVVERVAALQQIASVALRSEKFEEAEQRFVAAASLARSAGRRSSAVINDVNAVLARTERGEFEGAEARLTRAVHQLELLSGSVRAAQASVLLADVQYASGELSTAGETITAARNLLGSRENALVETTLCRWEARLAWLRGDLATAMRRVDEAERLAMQVGSASDVDRCACVRMQIQLALGERKAVGAAMRSWTGNAAALAWNDLAEYLPLGLPLTALPECEREANRVWFAALESIRAQSPDRAALQDLAETLATGTRRTRGAWARQMDHVVTYALQHLDGGEPFEEARAALRACERMGHVWWEAYWLRVLARDTRDAYYEERLDELIVRIARALPDATAQRKLMVAWAPPA